MVSRKHGKLLLPGQYRLGAPGLFFVKIFFNIKVTKTNKINPKIGRYISLENNISDVLGIELLFIMIFSKPLPKEAIMKTWGNNPISDPKK